MGKKRGNVWLAVSGIVENSQGEWLVVKKNYGGLKGKWSFPAGFVDEGETVEEAVIREVKEETGIDAIVNGVIGVRSGVLKKEISDNMIIFHLQAITDTIVIEENEVNEVKFFSPQELLKDPASSLLLIEFARRKELAPLHKESNLNPGDHFGYRSYTLFL
ncbi:NUDIX domain-containing protein [Bacillus kexueae]|uniref:NUDIX domain-containing protein n=1 Tax=Aeribacillus kexueae TaxID=2078952 RepID=UPI001FB02493|nr:NUDIX hydrolase [Bacillus kexueae]